MQSLFELPDEEWIDCESDFETALSELSIGQLVQDPRYTMMDLMSAIEVSINSISPPSSQMGQSYCSNADLSKATSRK
jgi:hypothetical protein